MFLNALIGTRLNINTTAKQEHVTLLHVNNKDFFCVWTTKAQTKLRMRRLPCNEAYLGVYISNYEL